MAERFAVRPILIEPNPMLADALRASGSSVVACALGTANGSTIFHIGGNDEASSVRLPKALGRLVPMDSLAVPVRTLSSLREEFRIPQFVCVKLDIEGAEVDVITSLGPTAREVAPQWTVEFHDGDEFGLCEPEEVDQAIHAMRRQGFSVLVRNWPSRTNVLFVDRKELSISWLYWAVIKIRYQYLAALWRKAARIV